jgi:tetratricopeptide (TPR) repeat protein
VAAGEEASESARAEAREAAHDLHEESRVHEILWLSLFALGDYQGAAIEAHAVVHFGLTPTWANIVSMYGKPEDYTTQLRKLEDFVGHNQDSTYGTFLLGFEYLALGHKDAAKPWLQKAVALAPDDVMANKLLQSLAEEPAGLKKPEPQVPAPSPAAGEQGEATAPATAQQPTVQR